MAAKQVLFHDSARHKMVAGVNVLANCAGPVAIARWEGWRPE